MCVCVCVCVCLCVCVCVCVRACVCTCDCAPLQLYRSQFYISLDQFANEEFPEDSILQNNFPKVVPLMATKGVQIHHTKRRPTKIYSRSVIRFHLKLFLSSFFFFYPESYRAHGVLKLLFVGLVKLLFPTARSPV